jgi:hypothetical protein
MEKSIVFLHIPKTAGTSLRSQIAGHFAPSQVYPEWFSFRNVPLETMSGYKFIAGHFPYSEIKTLPQRTWTFTFLREPRARILSIYNFWRSHSQAWLDAAPRQHTPHVRFAREHSFLECIETDFPAILGNLDNGMCRQLLPQSHFDAKQQFIDREKALQDAIAVIDRLDFVGFVEHFEESCARLGAQLGFIVDPNMRINVTSELQHNQDFEPVEQKTSLSALEARAMSRFVEMDDVLYDLVEQRFRKEGRAPSVLRLLADPAPAAGPPEIFLTAETREAWTAQLAARTGASAFPPKAAFLKTLQAEGLFEPITGAYWSPEAIRFANANYRDGLKAGLLSSRNRAAALVLQKGLASRSQKEPRIYAHEAITDFARFLRANFTYFVGSEYAADPEAREDLFPLMHQDAGATTFEDGRFDFVLSNDVMEHVPDPDAVLGETLRILKPGGAFLATFPFKFNLNESEVRARIEDGEIRHLMEPVYHGNPVAVKARSLVFTVPGWDICDRARAVGFAFAGFDYIVSARHGVLGGPDLLGVHVFRAEKAPALARSL